MHPHSRLINEGIDFKRTDDHLEIFPVRGKDSWFKVFKLKLLLPGKIKVTWIKKLKLTVMDNLIKLTPNTELDPQDVKYIEEIYKFIFSVQEQYMGFGEFCIKFAEKFNPLKDPHIYDVNYKDNYIEIWKTDDTDLKNIGSPGFIRIS